LFHPFEQIFEVVKSALPEPSHLACPVDQRGQGAKLRAMTVHDGIQLTSIEITNLFFE
jgi:hypothetical protein